MRVPSTTSRLGHIFLNHICLPCSIICCENMAKKKHKSGYKNLPTDDLQPSLDLFQ